MSDRRPVRCGWCISGHHERCIHVVRMGVGPSGKVLPNAVASYLWWCPCEEGGHPESRCVLCLRPGVDVDDKSECRDTEDCQHYRRRRWHPAPPPEPEEADDAQPAIA